MATAPVKQHPKPLHNFPLPLKWSQTAAGSATSSRPLKEPEAEPDRDVVAVRNHRPPPPSPHPVGSRSARQQRFSFSSCSKTAVLVPTAQKKEVDGEAEEEDDGDEEEEEEEEEAENPRPWKLRPRRGFVSCPGNSNHHPGGELAIPLRQTPPPPRTKPIRPSRGSAEASGGGFLERKEKRKFWIALSKEEIEEDVYSLTGSRPSRRPQKRPKNVQKSVDNVFPGLWLVGSTVDSYKSPDTPIKR